MRTMSGPIRGTGLGSALFTKVQQKLLAALYGNPARTFYANELIHLARSGTGAVQRELARLEAVGLITATRVGNQKHYRANTNAVVFEELRGLVLKTFGLADVLRAALAPLAPNIRAAFIYGSIAKREDSATSDIDLMIVSDTVSYAELFAALEDASNRLGRKISPTVYSPEDVANRIAENNAFVTRVMSQPKIWLIGEDRDVAA